MRAVDLEIVAALTLTCASFEAPFGCL